MGLGFDVEFYYLTVTESNQMLSRVCVSMWYCHNTRIQLNPIWNIQLSVEIESLFYLKKIGVLKVIISWDVNWIMSLSHWGSTTNWIGIRQHYLDSSTYQVYSTFVHILKFNQILFSIHQRIYTFELFSIYLWTKA